MSRASETRDDARGVDPAEPGAERAAVAALEPLEVPLHRPGRRGRRPRARRRSSAAWPARRGSRCRSRCRRDRACALVAERRALRRSWYWPHARLPATARAAARRAARRSRGAGGRRCRHGEGVLDLRRRRGLVRSAVGRFTRSPGRRLARCASGERRASVAEGDGRNRCIRNKRPFLTLVEEIAPAGAASPSREPRGRSLRCGLAIPTEGAPMKALVIVDMLDDFVTGALANPHAERIVEPLGRLLAHARASETGSSCSRTTRTTRRIPSCACGASTRSRARPGAQVVAELEPQPGPGGDRLAQARLRRLRRHRPRRATARRSASTRSSSPASTRTSACATAPTARSSAAIA